MKAGRSTDGVVYPDVGHQISDLVSQQPDDAQQAEQSRAIEPRQRIDEFQSVVGSAFPKLDRLTKKGFQPLSDLGFIPRPPGWNANPAIFHDPKIGAALRELASSLGSETKLQELADDLVADSQEGPVNMQHFVTSNFGGMVFPAGPEAEDDPVRYAGERSLHTLDELRNTLFDARAGSQEKSSALLQFRAKLGSLGTLGEWIQNSFADMDYLELSRVKTPLLC